MTRPDDIDVITDVRAALHTAPDGSFRAVDVGRVMRSSRRRRRARRIGAAAAAAVAAVALVAALDTGGWLLRSTRTTLAPAVDRAPTVPTRTVQGSATLSPSERHEAWVTWAGCLREADIPGVTVTGPVEGSDDISYTDDAGNPLPGNYREQSGEWGSATEYCAERVPGLRRELEARWGDLTSGPTALQERIAAYQTCLTDHGLTQPSNKSEAINAEAVGCVWAPRSPDDEKIMQCTPGHEPSGIRSIWDAGPWLQTPADAGQEWLGRQTDRDEFASVEVIDFDGAKAGLHVLSNDGRTTGVVYLLVNTVKGYRLHGMDVCQPVQTRP